MVAALPELNEWRDWDALRSLQQDRLGDVLAHARRTQFYRDRLPAVWEDVPLTTKADLRASYPFGLLAVAPEQIATYHETTGTTGDATASLFTEHDWHDVASRCVRNGVELRASDWLLIKSPYALVNAAPQIERAARMRGAAVIAGDSLSANMPYDRVLHLLQHLPITVVWCWATELLLWAAAARRADRALPGASVRAFLVMGEVLSETKRAHVEKVWGQPVFQDFGSVETGSLAGECRERRLHLWADRLLFELYDPVTGRFSREGRGQLVVTPLFREAMALVRYHLGDVAEISYAPCACGWRLPTIRIWGRPTTLAVVGGREVFPVDVEDVVFRLPHEYAVWFWRARPRGGELEIEIASPAHAAAACGALRTLVHDRLGIAAEVRAVPQDALVPPALFDTARALQKPQFMVAAGEPWGPIVRH